jgi:GT2 family glycosyltransferase
MYDALNENNVKDIMIVTRETDKKTIDFWKNKAMLVTVPHYEINGRHNMDKIAEKRQLIIDYAKKKYDAIWFVDSDVIPTKGILNELMKTNKDICLAPYRVKWFGSPCIGISSNEYPYVKLHKIDEEDKKENRKPFIIGGFACTLIKKSTFDIKVETKEITNSEIYVKGEDVGFFINCNNAGLKCEYLPNNEQPHYYDR